MTSEKKRRKNVKGTIYLLHFDKPYKHARHYIGWTENLPERMEKHVTGQGSRLIQVITDAGIGFKIARVWYNVDRYFERRIKNHGHTKKLCSCCCGEDAMKRFIDEE